MKKYFLLILSLFLLSGCQKEMKNESEPTGNESKPKELVDANLTDEYIQEINKVVSLLPDHKKVYGSALKATELTNQELLGIALGTQANNKSSVENAINNLFGSSIKVTVEDYICPYGGHISLAYDVSSDSFIDVELGHGAGGIDVFDHVLNIKTDGEKYYANVVRMYSGYIYDVFDENTPYVIYKTYEDSDEEKNPVVENLYATDYCYNYNCDFDRFMTENQNKLNKYTYVFNMDNDNLYFEEYYLS